MCADEKWNIPWKETAWNGIRFRAPADWEPAGIGNRYLMLENEAGPALELKWGPIKGSFSHRRHLARLAKNFRRHSGIRIRECPLPIDWKRALTDFEGVGFLWTGKRMGGRGVVLYCRACRHATLMQFYGDRPGASDGIERKILGSFKDHNPGGETLWAIFDIRAVVPLTYDLKYHRFEPGRFELSFSSGRQKLTLYRWSPAGAALSERSLEQFAKMMIPMLQAEGRFRMTDAGGCIDFEYFGKTFLWRRLKTETTAQTVRVWHEPKKNKILGIRIEGDAAVAAMMRDTLSQRYETL